MKSILFAAFAASTSVSALAADAKEAKRGVYYFESAVDCPLAGVGQRGAKDCIRIALDDDHSVVTVDAAAKKIILTNDTEYKKKQLIADIAIPAVLISKSVGGFGGILHIKVEKSGHQFVTDPHAHMSNLRDFEGEPAIDTYEVILRDGTTGKLVASPKSTTEALKNKGKSYNFVQISPWTAGQKDAPADHVVLVDRQVSAGLKSLSKRLAHFRFSIKKDAPKPTSVAEAIKSPGWQLAIESLTSLLPQSDVNHDLFLYGLEDQTELKDIAKGAKKGAVILITANDQGAGTISYDGKQVDVPNLVEAVRQFLEFNSLGIAFRAELQAALKAH